MNTYKTTFSAQCPNDEHGEIVYTLCIQSESVIKVEAINELILTLVCEPQFHENLADELVLLGGYQVMTAVHHGVEITTYRGMAEKNRLADAIKQSFHKFGVSDWWALSNHVRRLLGGMP